MKSSIAASILEYRNQLRKGVIQEGYRALMEFYRDLRGKMKKANPSASVSSIQYGLMDFTYFFFASKKLAARRLKVAILFAHEPFAFELWLVGSNKQVQGRYQKLLADRGWNRYSLADSTQGVFHIVRKTVAADPDFGDQTRLIDHLQKETISFVHELERAVS